MRATLSPGLGGVVRRGGHRPCPSHTISWGLGPILGNSVGGYVFEHYGAVPLFRGAAAIVFTVFVVFMASERPWRRRAGRKPQGVHLHVAWGRRSMGEDPPYGVRGGFGHCGASVRILGERTPAYGPIDG